jgi:hypothetical protein
MFLMVLSSGWANCIQPKNDGRLTGKLEDVPDGTLVHKVEAPSPIMLDLANMSTVSGNKSLTSLEVPSRNCRLSTQAPGWEPITRAYPFCYSLTHNMRVYTQNDFQNASEPFLNILNTLCLAQNSSLAWHTICTLQIAGRCLWVGEDCDRPPDAPYFGAPCLF